MTGTIKHLGKELKERRKTVWKQKPGVGSKDNTSPAAQGGPVR